MNSLGDDIFEFESECNPVEEHFMKQLNAIQNRIDKTKNEIEEIEETVNDISSTLLFKAVTGQDTSFDSSSDLYTIEGKSVLKTTHIKDKHSDVLLLKCQWQYVLIDKWVIGVVIQNTSLQPLRELRFYAFARGTDEIHGISAFWEQASEETEQWERINVIPAKKDNVVATLVLDHLDLDDASTVEIYGIIAYENTNTELQIALPVVRFASYGILHRTYELSFSGDATYALLALRSTFVETLLELPFKFETERLAHLLQSLNGKTIAKNVYGVGSTESSFYAVIEVLSLTKIRLSAKTTAHLKMILRVAQDELSIPVTRCEEESCVEAAKALLGELETYLDDSDLTRVQRARIRSDLLIR